MPQKTISYDLLVCHLTWTQDYFEKIENQIKSTVVAKPSFVLKCLNPFWSALIVGGERDHQQFNSVHTHINTQ